MNITTENLNNHHLKVNINLDPQDYLPKVEESIKSVSKKMAIPGFRPGKVPVGVTKKMHGNELLAEELGKMLNESLENYIKENNLNILGEPIPSKTEEQPPINILKPSSYQFGFEMGIMPDFEIPNLENEPSFTLYTITLEEEKINEEVEKFRVRAGVASEVEAIGPEDVLEANFAELDKEGNVKEGGINANSRISLTSVVDKSVVDKILPLKKGEYIDFDINEAFGHNHDLIVHTILNIDHHAADEMNPQFRMTVNGISHVEKAAIGTELFDKIFGEGKIKTEEEMRDKVRKEIKAQYEKTAEHRLFYDITNFLIDKTNIDLPVEFLKKWILSTNKNPITPEQLEKEFDTFVRQMKWDLITEKIVKDKSIEIKPEELKKFVGDEFRSRYFDGQVDAEMEKSVERVTDMILDNEKNRKEYINKLLENKIFEELKKKAKIEAKEISYHDYIHS